MSNEIEKNIFLIVMGAFLWASISSFVDLYNKPKIKKNASK